MEPNLPCRKWQSTIAMKKVPKCNCNVEVSKVPLLCRKYQSTIAMKKGDCARLEATCPLASFPCFLWGNASGNFSYEEIPLSALLTSQCQFGQSILECCQRWQLFTTFESEALNIKQQRNVMSSILREFWKLFLTQGRALTSPWPGRPLLPRSVCLQGPAKVKFSIKSFDSYLSSEIYLSSSPSPGSLQGTEERSDLCSKRFQFLLQIPQDLQTWCER